MCNPLYGIQCKNTLEKNKADYPMSITSDTGNKDM